MINTVIIPYYSKNNHKMGNKDFNPNEGDLIQQSYDKKDEQEKLLAKHRKKDNIKKRRDDEEERLEVEKEIIKIYGSKVITDEKFIKKHITSIYASNCETCNTYKIYPYEFINGKGGLGFKNNCTACMKINSDCINKYKNDCKKKDIDEKVECPCGKHIYPNDLERHNETLYHINGVAQLRIRGLNKVLNVKELRFLASANNIKLYYTLKASVIIDNLIRLGKDVVILEEFK